MKKFIQTTFMAAIITTFAIGSAFAMDLSSAKSSGLIGEKQNGLVEATLPNPSGDITDLVNSTNSGRLEVYKQTAAQQGIALREVQAIAAQKIYDLASPGEFLMKDGKWIRK